jgi:hypothetical protein
VTADRTEFHRKGTKNGDRSLSPGRALKMGAIELEKSRSAEQERWPWPDG